MNAAHGIVPRVGWRAKAPRDGALPRPASTRRGVVVHFNGPAMVYTTPAAAMGAARGIQRYHQEDRGWADVAYSYLVDQFGHIYEGRGDALQFANGADVVGPFDGPDREWFTVMWMGGLGQTPTAAALASLTWLVERKRAEGAGMALRPHCDFRIKPCPGPELIEFCRRYDGRPFPRPAPKITTSEEDEMPAAEFIVDPKGPYPSTPPGRIAGWLARIGGDVVGVNGSPDPGAVGEVVAVERRPDGSAVVVTKAVGDDYPTYILGQV